MSALFETKSKNGMQVLRVNSMHLCSIYNPDAEALKWVASNAKSIEAAEVIFVLGLGCGYHAVELAAQNPQKKIIVIEHNVEIANWFWRNTNRQVANLSVVRLNYVDSPASWMVVSGELARPYVSLIHMPSFRLSSTYYSKIHSRLLTRDSEALHFFREVLNCKQTGGRFPEVISVGDECGINIRNILNNECGTDRIWKAMGELVK